MSITPEAILHFWFNEVGPARWFAPDPELDQLLLARFESVYARAAANELKKWEETPEGMLALLLVLDFFARRMFRGTPKAYEADDLARDLARSAIIRHFDDRIDRNFKLFFYLPFQHSEHLGDQRLSIFYIRERTKDPEWTQMAESCLHVIQRFGRFPARNAILGRPSSPEETQFLASHPTLSD